MNPVRTLIVDDDDRLAGLMSMFLGGEPGIEILARARNGREALDLVASLSPDVVLMDLHMPVLDGIEATREMREAGFRGRILIVTASGSPEELARAREAGGDGDVRKDRIGEELLPAILAGVAR